ncbi:hypothetical protein HPP92_020618 [Vanilla planifolia]|uniref:Uncharacterized protein n=1 Tax=Vanilla planifolia TaxID=51239 RepID=A0A835UHS1_VANPL|nr:hypothetical protein HPP92_020618 [Vanilla planifolia]
MDRKPPVAVSPRRLRPRRPPTSLSSLQTPTAPKTSARPPLHFPTRHSIAVDSLLHPAHPLLPSDPKATTKASKDDTSASDILTELKTSPLFERGRFYEVYSARRNERLKRKMAMEVTEETVAQYPEVAVELSRREL